MARKSGGSKWIQKALSKPKSEGALHRALGVPMGEKIPASKMKKAMDSPNPHMKKMASLAKTLKKLNK